MLCFVTVGTTQFDALVEAILKDDVLRILRYFGVDELFVQFGKGRVPEGFTHQYNGAKESWQDHRHGISIRLIRFVSNLTALMRDAYFIIGHAGAGTCLEALELRKPLVVVINDALADNHQLELAERLAADGNILHTRPADLADTLRNPKLFALTPFESVDSQRFGKFLDEFLGVR